MSKPLKVLYYAAAVALTVMGNPIGVKMLMAGGSYEASRASQREAARKARVAANKRAKDVEAMTLQGVTAQRYVYGKRRVGGNIIYALNTGTKREYLHLVVKLVDCECSAIDSIWFGDTQLPLTMVGNVGTVESGSFTKHKDKSTSQSAVGSTTSMALTKTPTRIVSVVATVGFNGSRPIRNPVVYVLTGSTVTFSPAVTDPVVNYEYADSITPLVTIEQYLGTPGQPHSSALVSASGGGWTANHRGTNVCYLYVKLHWDQDVFGSVGLPQIMAVVRGKKVFDPRKNDFVNYALSDAVVGGSAGTGVVMGTVAGMTRSVTAVGESMGIPYVEVTFTGTPSASGLYSLVSFAGSPTIPIALGDVVNTSSWTDLSVTSSGAAPGLHTRITGMTSGAGVAGSLLTDIPARIYTGKWFDLNRIDMQFTSTLATAVTVVYRYAGTLVAGTTYTIRLRIGLPCIGVNKKAYDYSENSVLQMADWLRDWRLGVGSDFAELNMTEIGAEANICDEQLVIDAVGTTQARYATSFSVESTESPQQVAYNLADAMLGEVVWVQGRWYITCGHYQAPVLTITDSMLGGTPPKVRPDVSRQSLFNTVKGRLVDPLMNYAEVDVLPVTFDAYRTEDGGRRIDAEFDLSYIDNYTRAQRLFKAHLQKARQTLALELECNYSAYDAMPTRGVAVTINVLGMAGKEFVVDTRTLVTDRPSISLSLAEHGAAIYDWVYNDLGTPLDIIDTTLDNPYLPPNPPATLTLASGNAGLQTLADGTVIANVLVTWPATDNIYVQEGGWIETDWKLDTDTDWQAGAREPGDSTSTLLGPMVEDSLILVRTRFVSSLPKFSAYTYAVPHTVVGKSANPTDPTGLTATIVAGVARIKWDKSPDADYFRSWLKYDGANFASATQLTYGAVNSFDWTFPDVGSHTLRLKHEDTTGHFSNEATLIVSPTGVIALALVLSNSNVTLTADKTGLVSNYSSAVSEIRVYIAGVDDTANWTISKADSSCTSALNSSAVFPRTVTVSNLLTASDTGYVDVTATRSGYSTLTQRLSLSKSKTGADGIKGDPGAGAFTIVKTANMSWDGSSAIRTGGTTGYNEALHSAQSYTNGAGMSFTAFTVNSDIVIGLNDVASAGNSYTDMDYAFHITSAGELRYVEAGAASVTLGATYVAGDLLSLTYNGAQIVYYKNGTALRTVAGLAPNLRFYLDSTFNATGGRVDNLTFFPVASAVKTAFITATSQVFQLSKAGVGSPTNITFQANGTNCAGSPVFSITAGSTLTGSGTTRDLSYANMGTGTDAVTVTMTWDGQTDQITVVRVREGSDAVTSVLTNEAFTLQATAAGAVSDFTGANSRMMVYIGAVDDSANWAYTRALGTGITTAALGAGADKNLLTVSAVTTAMANSYVDITATKSGYPDQVKRVSISKSRTGAVGTNASVLTLFSSALTFTYSGLGAATPSSQTITCTARLQNISGSVTFVCTIYNAAGTSLGTVTMGGTVGAVTRTLTNAQFVSLGATAQYAVITATLSSYTDTVTITKLVDGSPTSQLILTNEATTVPSDLVGVVSDFTGASTGMIVYVGDNDDTANGWAFTKVDTNVTSNIVGTTLTVTAMTTGSSTGYVDITATKGSTVRTKRMTITKSKAATAVGMVSFVADVDDFRVGPSGSAKAVAHFLSNGTIQSEPLNGTNSIVANWYDPTTTGAGSSYSVKVKRTSATSGATVGGSALDTWIALSTEPSFFVQTAISPSLYFVTCMVSIALTSNTSQILSTGYINFESEKT